MAFGLEDQHTCPTLLPLSGLPTQMALKLLICKEPVRIRATLEKVILAEEFTEDFARDIAFHMTDWLNNLEDYYNFCQAPESLPAGEVEKLLLAFLIQVPNHLAAAAKLFTEIPVSDIFGVGATRPIDENES